MRSYDAGIVTAYGAAVLGGYTGSYAEFCQQQAQYANNAAAVERTKNETAELRSLAQAAANAAAQSLASAIGQTDMAQGYASAAQIAQAAAEAAVQTVLDAIVSAQGNDMLRMDENGDFFILEEE